MSKINIDLVRKNGKTLFRFQVDRRITKVYENYCGGETKVSSNWDNIKYYHLPTGRRDENYIMKLESFKLIDDFGSSIVHEDKFNIAWLRSVNGKGEVPITSRISFAELSLMANNCLKFLKEHFEDYFKDFSIKGELKIEI